ncbi:MAG: polyhydroxyalkanoate synthesis repressor PhaR [Burkholderiales bacterium]|nr:polyhydroxyalkanoate synthesis repressor PhaR [Burkholderiales bacterium]
MDEPLRVIKKYPNRRLYDTTASTYITLADVKVLVLEHIPFHVIDAKTNEDLTRSILLQIILEEESGGVPMFSSAMLSQIIRFYGHAMQGLMGNYLEKNIHTFIDMQQRLKDQSLTLYGDNPLVNADAWTQFVKMQGPTIQGLMGSYLEQSANMFLEIQQQLQNQTRSLFGNFPFPKFKPGDAAGDAADNLQHDPDSAPESHVARRADSENSRPGGKKSSG